MAVVVEKEAPRRGIRFEVVDDAGWKAVRRILGVLEEEIGIVVEIEEGAADGHTPCVVCRTLGAWDVHHQLGHLCPPCGAAAARIETAFQVGLSRHVREFTDQLAQLVRDARAGAEEPVFYRGFE